jgi:hypothetical protein
VLDPHMVLSRMSWHKGYLGIRRRLAQDSGMRDAQFGLSQRSPSLPLQYRQCRSRVRDCQCVPDMHVGCGFLWQRSSLVNRSMSVT